MRGVQTVDHIFASGSASGDGAAGQDIKHPFQMVDLEFTPEGASEPVHALDRVDFGSVPGLMDEARVPVTYAVADPRGGQLSIGTRTYAEHALLYILGLTYGFGAVVAFLVFPALFLAQRLLNKIQGLMSVLEPSVRARLASSLPPDDPRRKTIEALISRRQHGDTTRDQ